MKKKRIPKWRREWTNEDPPVPGYYWLIWRHRVQVVRVGIVGKAFRVYGTFGKLNKSLDEMTDASWLGPIDEPKVYGTHLVDGDIALEGSPIQKRLARAILESQIERQFGRKPRLG